MACLIEVSALNMIDDAMSTLLFRKLKRIYNNFDQTSVQEDEF